MSFGIDPMEAHWSVSIPHGVNGHRLKIPMALRAQQDTAGSGLGSSHQVPGLGMGIMGQPVPFCPHREGAGVTSHPAQTPQREAAVLQPTGPAWSALCLSAYFSHLSSSPLLTAQFEAELLATVLANITGPLGQPWRWHLAVSCPGTGNLAPSQDICMAVLGQKLMTG